MSFLTSLEGAEFYFLEGKFIAMILAMKSWKLASKNYVKTSALKLVKETITVTCLRLFEENPLEPAAHFQCF